MISTAPNWNIQLQMSSELLSSDNAHLRQWLIIIGIVTVALLLLWLCVQCIAKVRHTYRTVDLDEHHSSSCETFSHQRILVNGNNSKYTCYPEFQCIKSIGETRQILIKFPKNVQIHEDKSRIRIQDGTSSTSVSTV